MVRWCRPRPLPPWQPVCRAAGLGMWHGVHYEAAKPSGVPYSVCAVGGPPHDEGGVEPLLRGRATYKPYGGMGGGWWLYSPNLCVGVGVCVGGGTPPTSSRTHACMHVYMRLAGGVKLCPVLVRACMHVPTVGHGHACHVCTRLHALTSHTTAHLRMQHGQGQVGLGGLWTGDS